MGDIIAFRPKKVSPEVSLPVDVANSIQLVMQSFPFEYISSISKVTVENLRMAAIRGLLKCYEKGNGKSGLTTVECGNFNCTFENIESGPHFYLDWVIASSYSRQREGA